jgi:sirohydrochlorin cobaltochelatase
MREAPSTQLVLYAHGSRDARWRSTFEQLAAVTASQVGPDAVQLAYLELSAPTLAATVKRAARAGVGRLRVLPLFFAAGKHLRDDVAARVDEARARHPQLEIELLPSVGEDERMRSLLRDIAREAATRS